MKKRILKVIGIILLIFTLLCSCGNHSSEYVGTYLNGDKKITLQSNGTGTYEYEDHLQNLKWRVENDKMYIKIGAFNFESIYDCQNYGCLKGNGDYYYTETTKKAIDAAKEECKRKAYAMYDGTSGNGFTWREMSWDYSKDTGYTITIEGALEESGTNSIYGYGYSFKLFEFVGTVTTDVSGNVKNASIQKVN